MTQKEARTLCYLSVYISPGVSIGAQVAPGFSPMGGGYAYVLPAGAPRTPMYSPEALQFDDWIIDYRYLRAPSTLQVLGVPSGA